jgi:hypothetical protein
MKTILSYLQKIIHTMNEARKAKVDAYVNKFKGS